MPPHSKTLQESLDSLRSLSPRLNAVTDLANKTVLDVEAFLTEECSIGVTAFVKYKEHEDGGGDFLEFRRVGPRFRIAIVTADEAGLDMSVKPWAEASRDAKLESFPKLPELLAEIASIVEKQIQESEATAKAVASTIGALRPVGGPGRPAPTVPLRAAPPKPISGRRNSEDDIQF